MTAAITVDLTRLLAHRWSPFSPISRRETRMLVAGPDASALLSDPMSTCLSAERVSIRLYNRSCIYDRG